MIGSDANSLTVTVMSSGDLLQFLELSFLEQGVIHDLVDDGQ